MAQRSLIRPDQLDQDASYQFSQLILDGYSLEDGYLNALVLKNGTDSIIMDAITGSINQIKTGQVTFAGNLDANNGIDVSGSDLNVLTNLNVFGNSTLGDASTDTLDVKATIISNMFPTNNLYGLGGPSNAWADAYFTLFTPTNYTPIGNIHSLESHLLGIDAGLNIATSIEPPRGTYIATSGEGSSDSIDSSRTPNIGVSINVSGLTDVQFRDFILIYLDGQLLINDPSPAVNKSAVVYDVARKTGDLKTILFSANIKTNNKIQIFDLR
jgi:hypothetical protein